MVLEDVIPKIRNLPLVINAERIFQSSTDFIRGNPIVSTASVGAGITGLVIAGATIRKLGAKKKRKSKRKSIKKTRIKRGRGIKKKRVKKRSRITHSSPRHKGHKFVTFTTASGKKVKFKVKKKNVTHRNIKRRKR